MNLKALLKPIASLRLTVFCLGVGMVLIFAGTLEQVHLGIYAVQAKYFRSLLVLWEIPWLAIGGIQFGYIPLPGGYTLGTVLMVNLIAAHVSRFKLTWKKLGIFLIHIGIILLLAGELLTGLFARETRMVLDEGERSSYSEAERVVEMAIVDAKDDGYDKVVVIPERVLAKEGVTQHPHLPFEVHIRKFMGNSELVLNSDTPDPGLSPATTGLGVQMHAVEKERTGKPGEVDTTTVFAELRAGEKKLGTLLLSNGLRVEQSITFDGRVFKMSLRRQRDYKPFALKLVDFTHDRYAGTDIPKNFSSLVEIDHPAAGSKREVLIYMNNPLRYGGFTFYQASFDNDDTRSILRVVKNPVWIVPYVACALVALGLFTQFGFHLLRFTASRSKK